MKKMSELYSVPCSTQHFMITDMPKSQESLSSFSILIVNLAKAFGGAEVRVIETVRHLGKTHRCVVAALAGSPLLKKLEEEKLPVIALPYKRADPRLARAITIIIKKHRFNVVDTHNPQSNVWGMLGCKWAGGASLVTTVHSSRDITVSFFKTALYDLTLRINSWFGSHFIAVSESVSEYLTDLSISPSNITLVKNGLTLPVFGENKKNTGSIRQECGWQDHHFVIILVGRLEPIKGHRFFISALPEIVKKHPHVRCLIVGTGRSETQLKTLRDDLGLTDTVYFAGFRENISQLLTESDAFCMPSLSEGLPYALLEACSHKIPVLCTKVGGMAELLENGYSAVLAPPRIPIPLRKELTH